MFNFQVCMESYFAFRICSSVLMSYKSATQGTMIVVLQLVTYKNNFNFQQTAYTKQRLKELPEKFC